MNKLLHRILDPALKLLHQGLTPHGLALALSLGFVISCFPVFGATTGFCAIVAIVLRLNLPAMQLANYAAMPLQFLLLIPFIRLGEILFRTESLPLNLGEIRKRFETAPMATLQHLWMWEWHAMVAWAVLAVPITILLFFTLRFFLSRIRLSQKEEAFPATGHPLQ
jgi:hypothetical protein